jgi:hypothetical protein
MDILQLTQDALKVIQQMEPGLTAAVKVGTELGTVGTAAVQVIQKGQQLVTYLITRRKVRPPESPKLPDELEPVTGDKPVATKRDVVLLVDINRRMLQDVARFVDERKLDADLIVVTNDTAYSDKVKFLKPDDPAAWAELVREFTAAMNAIKHAVGGARLHIFLSTPLPLAFGLGSVWGTVDEATVYHWENQTYYPSMRISRELRQ